MAKRERTEDRQTIQWPKEKGQKKDRQYNGQKRNDRRKTDNTMAKRETTEERQTIQWPKEKRQKKDRQYNGQKRNDNRTNNDPQNSTQKIKSISPTRL